MIRFECDYSEGAHPKILEMLTQTNFEQTERYGKDKYCEKARDIIKNLCNAKNAEVHFLVGGTQTNLTVISSILRSHQGVISAQSGHISVYETGAIEATGHKIIALPSNDGKITAQQVEKVCLEHWNDAYHEHAVQPGMVYISHPTENGTIYSKAELTALSDICRKYNLPLYIDGARLGYGLTAQNSDLTLPDIAKLSDVFYIGGTKNGALFGEAPVITNPLLQKDFRYFIKQRGGMLAKGRLLGIQFIALLENNLYFDMAENANKLAMQIKQAFKDKGYSFLYESFTNQQFPILPCKVIEILERKYEFSTWEKVDENHCAVRFCTSWATKEDDVIKLVKDIQSL